MRRKGIAAVVIAAVILVGASFHLNTARAHCDRVNGPVAKDARAALRTGDVEKVLIWVGQAQANELRDAFEQAQKVRKMGEPAAEMADRYFMETAVRLHRQAEGMPYTGLKPPQPPADDIAAAEKALDTGDATIITDLLKDRIETETQKWFQKAVEAKKHKDQSVQAGREYADAYVKYIIYVHTLHQKIQAGPPHGVGEPHND